MMVSGQLWIVTFYKISAIELRNDERLYKLSLHPLYLLTA